MSNLEDKLKTLPDSPGVYIMKDRSGEIIYIGKAVSLKNRVRQYFQSSRNHTPKVRSMVQRIFDFEYILTDTELEALILECNLIKKHRPKYNILLKDDKHYPYIKVTTGEEYPRVLLVRKIAKDKNKYFGPYTSSKAVRDTIDVIKKIFPIRSCNKNLSSGTNNARPCLHYHINQCLGPCQGNVDKQEYGEMVKQVCKFLDGKHEDLIGDLKREMNDAAQNLQFEKAALIRDKIVGVEKVMESQKIISADDLKDKDVIVFVQDNTNTMVRTFFIRKGKLIGTQYFLLENTGGEELSDVMESFIKQFYLVASFIPKEILLQQDIDGRGIIEKWLSERRGSKVYIYVPQRGEKRKLVDLAIRNAEDTLSRISDKAEREKARTEGACEQLADYLDLEKPPYRIEAFDISNIQGTESVASMVVFEGGKPKNKDYRRFKIKSVVGPNDFASMAEVVYRRFKRGLEEKKELEDNGEDIALGKFSNLPDLILIDGGKGQLGAAVEVIDSLGIGNIPIIGLAEKFEEVFVPGKPDPIIIPKDAEALHLLQRIRDEAHRFAITYHRSLRNKDGLRSVLEDVPGIGPKRRKALYKRFGSVEAIKNASLEELAKVDGMNMTAAQSLKEYFQ